MSRAEMFEDFFLFELILVQSLEGKNHVNMINVDRVIQFLKTFFFWCFWTVAKMSHTSFCLLRLDVLFIYGYIIENN